MRAVRRMLAGVMLTVTMAACGSSDVPTGSSGAFLIRARTTGVEQDTDGYSVLISPVNAQGSMSFSIGINDSIVVTHQRLGSYESYWMQLRGMASNCWPAVVSFTQAGAVPDQVTPVDFVVECTASNRNVLYDRLTPHSAATIALHGTLRELYVLNDDDRFRLQYTSDRLGAYEYLGNVTRMPNDELTLTFEGDTRWQATARFRGDSLIVSYNELMLNAAFEPGLFVRRQSGN